MIVCKECGAEFNSIITNSHLKKHGITTQEYIKMHGVHSLSDTDYRNSRKEQYTGSNNPNYGRRLSEESRKAISEKAKGRIPWNKGEKKEKAQKTTITPSERGKKAAITRKNNGSSMPMSGKKHTESTKQKMADASRTLWADKKEHLRQKKIARMKEYGYTVLSMENDRMQFSCDNCKAISEYHDMYSDESRITAMLCPTCNPRYVEKSSKQLSLFEWLKGYFPDTIYNYKINGTRIEIDLYVPSKNIGFEYDGLYWHSQEVLEHNGFSKTKSYEKYVTAKTHGVRIFCIFEDEYLQNEEIVKSRILNILGMTSERIYARKCSISEISSEEANTFLNENHLQGSGRSNVRIGLFHNGTLVSVMTFSNSNVSRKLKGWELNRFSSKCGIVVVGGASRLFSYFVNKYAPQRVISYSDTRWSDGNLYSGLGFSYEGNTRCNYWYFKRGTVKRLHRFSLRKRKDDDPLLTEYENRVLNGYSCIFDYGSGKWTWNRELE